MYASEQLRYDDGDVWSLSSRRQSDSLSGYQQRSGNQYSESQMAEAGGYGYQQSSVNQAERNGRLTQSNIWDDYEGMADERGGYQSSGNNYDMVSNSSPARPIESIQGLRSHQAEPRRTLYSQPEQERYGSLRQSASSNQAWDDRYSTAQPLMERETESWMYCHACDMSFEKKILYLSHCQERFHKDMVARKLGGSSRLNQSKTASLSYGQMSRQSKDSWKTDIRSDYTRVGDTSSSGMARQYGGSQMTSRQTYSNIDDRAQGNGDWYSSGGDPYGREREVSSYSGSGNLNSGVSGMGGMESRRGILGDPQLSSDSRRESSSYYSELERRGQIGNRGDPGRGMMGSRPRINEISRIEAVDNSFSGSVGNRYGSLQKSPAVHMTAAERRNRTPVGQMSSTPYRSATSRPQSLLDVQNWKKPVGGAVRKPAPRSAGRPVDIRISKEQVANALKKIKTKSATDLMNMCKVCGIGGSTGVNINEFHWKGKKHFHACFKAMLQLGPKQFFLKYGKLPPTPHASYGVLKAAATQQSPYQRFMYKSGVANAYHCKVCETPLNSLDSWVKHVTSNQHKENCNQRLQKGGLEMFLDDFPTTPAPFLTDDETVKTLPGYEDLESRFPHGDEKPAGVNQTGSAAGTDKVGQGSNKQPVERPQGAGQRRKEDNRMTSEQKRPGTQGMTASGYKARKPNAAAMRATNVRQPAKRVLERGTEEYGMPKTRRIESYPGMRPNAPQNIARRNVGGRPLIEAGPVQPLFPEVPSLVRDGMRRQKVGPSVVPQLLDERPSRFMDDFVEPMPQEPMPPLQQKPGPNPRNLAMQLQQLTGVTDSETIMQAVNILSTVNLESLQGMSNASLDVLQRMIPMVQELGQLAGMDSQPLINQLTESLMQGRLNPNDLLMLLQQARMGGGVGQRRRPPPPPRPLPLMRPAEGRMRARHPMRGQRVKGRGRARP